MRVSVIIPTRDRAEYLPHSLATALAIPDGEIEILVSDNASTDATPDIIAAQTDPRFRAIATGRRVSMRQNFEFALEEARGDYVIVFGDDDGILPAQFSNLLSILERDAPDGLSWDYPVYGWPAPGRGAKAGSFRLVRGRTFGAPEPLDLRDRRAMLARGQLHRFHPAPGIYHACMSRRFLRDTLAAPDGTMILARSPDTWVSMRAIQHGGRFLHCRHPFSLNGFGTRSTGTSFGARGRAEGSHDASANAAFVTESQADPVEDVIPLAGSVPLGFLSTLETLRHHFPDEDVRIAHVDWYRTVINDLRKKDADTANEVMAVMTAHAQATGTDAALDAARARPRSWLVQARALWHKNADKLASIRVDGAAGGVNTIATAVAALDRALGADYRAVLSGDLARGAAWTNTRRRNDAPIRTGADETEQEGQT
ncbi:glycosyltransferase family 2 protein [uncultured Jannaschia sp.]|uniref:glycosyltransferase family 2 protein n=1 Tax=uncultured Jannaschia sp. TaxID=293347 RepID=UPI00261C4802|nr:glycosyltransferase family 2 protein [uncultured Jannaschia sp.]